MNNERRKKLNKTLSELKELRRDEESAFENMPEALQAAERGQRSYNAVLDLTQAIRAIEDALKETRAAA